MPNAREIYKQGFDLFVTENFEGAIEKYREAIAQEPGFALAWNGLSIALGRLGRLDEAIEAGQKLVEIEPDDALSHTNLSRLLQQKGLIQEAEDERAIAMNLQMKAEGR